MAQVLIKSISNNKPPEPGSGSGLELAAPWQEPRGSRCSGRVKRELPHGGAALGDGGEGLVVPGLGDTVTFPECWQGAEPPQRASTLLSTISARGRR